MRWVFICILSITQAIEGACKSCLERGRNVIYPYRVLEGLYMKKLKSVLLLSMAVIAAFSVFATSPVFATGTSGFIFLSPVSSSVTIDFYNDLLLEEEGLDSIRLFIITAVDPLAAIESLTISLRATPKMKDYEGQVTYILFGLGGEELAFFGMETATYSTNYSNSIEKTLSINAQFGVAVAGMAMVSVSEAEGNVPFTFRASYTEAAP
jgi:hypothetical protein